MKIMIRHAALALVCAAATLPVQARFDAETRKALEAAVAGEHRSDENKARDQYRKPLKTLEFLGFRSDMSVVEVWPGRGWYTQILAPALKDNGKLYAAQFSTNPPFGYQRRGLGAFLTMLGEKPDLYRQVEITTLEPPYEMRIAPAESADLVLTFRNVHNWVMEYYGSGRYAHLYFQAMYDALKPGGTLGIVDHRWPDPETEDPLSGNGYISVERTAELAKAAGFILRGSSDILANPKDDHDHPRGVWTLPPSLALGDEDRDSYLAIGESDRFLLRFEKPRRVPKKK